MEGPEPPPADQAEEPRGAEHWLAPFFRDSSLWPVTAVALLIFVVLGAAALLLALVERNPFAIGALLILFWMSLDVGIRRHRVGGSYLLLGCIAGWWLAALGVAFGVLWAGWF